MARVAESTIMPRIAPRCLSFAERVGRLADFPWRRGVAYKGNGATGRCRPTRELRSEAERERPCEVHVRSCRRLAVTVMGKSDAAFSVRG